MAAKYLISKELLVEKNLSGEALTVLIGLKMQFPNSTELYLNYSLLECYIYGWNNTDRNKRAAIISGFNELVDKNIINIKHKMSEGVMICDSSAIIECNKNHHYISITKQEFQTIISLDEKIHNYKLLRYFIDLLGSFNASKSLDSKYRFKICELNQLSISDITGVNLTTLNRYNEILTKYRLLYIVNRKISNVKNVLSGKIYCNMPNCYSRYEDKDLCDQYLKEKGYSKQNHSYINRTNEMRSLSQKYNYFARTYADKLCNDLNKVQAAYDAAVLWNEYAKQDYERDLEDGKPSKQPNYKDLTIFDKYQLK